MTNWRTKKLGEVCEIVSSRITPFEGEKEYIDTNSVQNFYIVKKTRKKNNFFNGIFCF